MKSEFGLKPLDLEYINKLLSKTPEVEKAVLFGSRAMGNYKNGSDVDIAILGRKVNFDVVAALHYKLEEESPLPYFFDIVDYTHLEKAELKDHIDRYGKEIFNRR